jgi:AraC-like DNA-binding protein
MPTNERIVAWEVAFQHLPEVGAYGFRLPTGKVEFKENRVGWHTLILVTSGAIPISITFQGDQYEHRLETGDACFIPAGSAYSSTEAFAPNTQFRWLAFKLFSELKPVTQNEASHAISQNFQAELPPFQQTRHFLPMVTSVLKDMEPVLILHRNILEHAKLYGMSDFGTRAAAAGFLYRLHLAYSSSMLKKPPPAMDIQSRPETHYANLARENIFRNYHQHISLRTVAKTLEINPSYLGVCFKKATGITVVDFIQKQRIEAAKSIMITQQHIPIRKVARACGFKSTTYFCRVFRKLEKMTPSGFAQRFRGARFESNKVQFIKYGPRSQAGR